MARMSYAPRLSGTGFPTQTKQGGPPTTPIEHDMTAITAVLALSAAGPLGGTHADEVPGK